ncbi:hypothetical protein [Pseudomonas parakoreensis]|uniref:hypothetical protein n=1 Tax=Pseudomonas parakoreensis TaxID=2892331 RepID=UPI001F2A5C18|nr:hypothetical protein [Pseudomonas parakoreensis]
MPDITVKTLKGFNTDGLNSGEKYVKRGAEITVDESLARDLRRNGLIEEYDVKNAQTPENKKAQEPNNKGAGKNKPAVQTKAT